MTFALSFTVSTREVSSATAALVLHLRLLMMHSGGIVAHLHFGSAQNTITVITSVKMGEICFSDQTDSEYIYIA